MSTLSRIAIGSTIFLVLASIDLYHNRARATRWREYLFLIVCVVAAIIYGIVNDQITSRISWEYFYYGKELDRLLGPETPPDPEALHRHAAIIGAEATWSAGLIIGVALLLANNPRRDRPRLSYRRLAKMLILIFLCSAGCGIVFGVGDLAGCSIGCRAIFARWCAKTCSARGDSSPHGACI